MINGKYGLAYSEKKYKYDIVLKFWSVVYVIIELHFLLEKCNTLKKIKR